jgi:hypothetical protein
MNQPIGQQLTANNLKNSFNGAAAGVANTLGSIRQNVNSTIQDFSSKSLSQQGSEFVQSNSIIAKFVFLILVLIIFMILFNLGVKLIQYFTKPKINPYVVKGLISGNKNLVISQDPKNSNSVTIYRSDNETTGIEFTWSVWLNITPDNFASDLEIGKLKHIFSKGGNGMYDINTGLMKMNNAPGLYLGLDDTPSIGGKQYKLITVMDTVASGETPYETIDVNNIPINQWFNLMIRLENKIMDIYINGAIVKRLAFTNVPKQNYDSVFVCGNGGFSGELSDLRYFNRSLNVFDINNIVYAGPNLKANKGAVPRSYDYLSSSWYSNNRL